MALEGFKRVAVIKFEGNNSDFKIGVSFSQ